MKKTVITIARSYGSGGRTLGKLLAEQLGINCYDREILRMASDASGINEALFGQADERLKRSPLFGILKKNPYKGGVIPPENSDFVSDDNLFNYQAKVIKELAAPVSSGIIAVIFRAVLVDFLNPSLRFLLREAVLVHHSCDAVLLRRTEIQFDDIRIIPE